VLKLAIFTIGSHGDVRPYVALGVELVARGHEVTLVTNPEDAQFCTSWGLNWKPLTGDLRKATELVHGVRDDLENKSSRIKNFQILQAVMRTINSFLDQQFQEVLAAAREADVLIYNPSVFSASHVGQALQKPFFQLQLQPAIPTKSHSSCFVKEKPPFGKLGNYATHLFFEQLFWQAIRKKINYWRCEKLRIPKINFFGPIYDPVLKKQSKWIAVSPSFIPSPKDWANHVKMTGFLYLNAAPSYVPSQALQSFLEAGPPPLYLGLGSLEEVCPKRSIDAILEVLKKRALRTLISSGLPIEKSELPNHCFLLEPSPHDWLFPRVSCLVHSGGIGTIAAGLKAGKPALILPFVTDHFFWGRRIFEMGIGPEPLPLKEIHKDNFAHSIDDLTTNGFYQKNALNISEKIKTEDGVKNVVKMLEEECRIRN
jgi:sterol 3beta-glucosyltransferase